MNLTTSEIRTHILTHFSANYTDTPVIYLPNEIDPSVKDDAFVTLSFNYGRSYSVLKGTGAVTRHTGTVFASIYVPLVTDSTFKKGSKEAFTLADSVLATLERQRLNNSAVITRAGSIDIDQENGGYYQIVVSVPFYVS